MTKQELLKKIQQLAFVKTELELFLDTHPNSPVALENYRECIEALDDLLEEYSEKHGPIQARDSVGDSWTWTDDPWPWQSDFPHNEWSASDGARRHGDVKNGNMNYENREGRG